MPVRARRVKRRFNAEAEINAWSLVFQCGRDYLGALEDFGGVYSGDRVRNEAVVQLAAEDAWRRLGADYMARWAEMIPTEKGRETPWAVEQFGQPSCR